MTRYKWTEARVVKMLELPMHALSLGIPFVGAVLALVFDLFNPVPRGLRRCYISIYPPNCSAWDGVECTKGSLPLMMALMVVPGLVSMTFFMCCSILLYLTIRQRLLRSSRTSQHNVLNNSQSMATQALLYSIFFFNTNIWLTLSFLIFFIGDVEKAKVPFAILVLGDLFWLSQGFFNFIIFIRPRFVRIFHRMRESDRQNSSSSLPRRSVILSFLSALRETVYYETGGNRSHITTSSEGGNDKNWIRSLFSRNRRSKQAPDIDIKSSQDQPKQEQREIPSLQFDNRQGC